MSAGEQVITSRGVAVHVVKRQLTLLPLVGLMFFTVSGGAYGLEDVISASGPGMAIILIIVTPIIWSLPAALMVAELSTALPVEGGFYQWVTFVDMALYPVLFADYLSQTYFPDGASGKVVFLDLGFVQFDVHWLLCLAVIWPFAYLNVRSTKGVGDTSTGYP